MPLLQEETYYFELDADGYRHRQIVELLDGRCLRSQRGDWPIDANFDLYDPDFPGQEMAHSEFEMMWKRALPDTRDLTIGAAPALDAGEGALLQERHGSVPFREQSPSLTAGAP